MKRVEQKNVGVIAVAVAILLAVNLAVWLAAQNGAITPLGNTFTWSFFAGVNVISIIWSVMLMGLQPLVVAISYVVGGILAFLGVRNLGGASVAEVTTAGATYGAFGALAVGNATAKVRLFFYDKKQVPLVFIIAMLLVIDAGLNSGVSSASKDVLLSTVIFPFVFAGGLVGFGWNMLVRYGTRNNSKQGRSSLELKPTLKAAEVQAEKEESKALRIEAPKVNEKPDESEAPVAVSEKESEPVVLEAKVGNSSEPVVPLAEPSEEEFFPLEIDKDDEFDVAPLVDVDPPVMNVGSSRDEGGAIEVVPKGGIEGDGSAKAAAVEEASAADAEETQSNISQPQQKSNQNDWLSGHMDLLSKLK